MTSNQPIQGQDNPYNLTPQQLQVHQRLQNNLPFYAANCLKIKDKGGNIVPFKFNAAQDYLHNRIEDQLRRIGMVRILIVKGRQQGCSTYVSARYYKKASWEKAKSIYILSHEASSTQNLFSMVDTYYNNVPEQVKPELVKSNEKTMEFVNGCKYRVGTAGSKNTGRSQTNQYIHGSEVAYYENTDEINSGLLQTVANIPGTEVILESTANGIGNFFHQACMDALAGKGLFELVFIPWYWQDEYAMTPPPGYEQDLSVEDRNLMDLYDLTLDQMYWRELKIVELKSESLFKQEYPFTVEEAFQSSGSKFIDPLYVEKARKQTLTDPTKPLILGVDPARKGDRTILTLRRGREVVEIIKYNEMDEMYLAGIVANLIDRRNVVKAFIDFGLGIGTCDRLKELGYGHIVTPVHFGEKSADSRFLNKRMEMAWHLKEWFEDEPCSVPDDDEIAMDIAMIPDFRRTSSGQLALVSKDDIKKANNGRSPDIFDSLMLTFAHPVKSDMLERRQITRKTVPCKKGSSVTTLNRFGIGKRKPSDSIDFYPGGV